MLNDESFEKHVSQGKHEGNLEAADEVGFEIDEEFVAVLGRVVDDPAPREEKVEYEAKKGTEICIVRVLIVNTPWLVTGYGKYGVHNLHLENMGYGKT